MMLKPSQLTSLRGMADLYRNPGYEHIEIHKSWLIGAAAHIEAQQARIAELEQDAARYRWLRDSRKSKSQNFLATLAVRHENGWSWRSAIGEELDEAIDAAMQK